MTATPSLWVMYGAAKPRRIVEIRGFYECGTTPAGLVPGWRGSPRLYRATGVEVTLANGQETCVPLGHVVYATKAGATARLAVPYGRFTQDVGLRG